MAARDGKPDCPHTGWRREIRNVPAWQAHMCDRCVTGYDIAHGIWHSSASQGHPAQAPTSPTGHRSHETAPSEGASGTPVAEYTAGDGRGYISCAAGWLRADADQADRQRRQPAEVTARWREAAAELDSGAEAGLEAGP